MRPVTSATIGPAQTAVMVPPDGPLRPGPLTTAITGASRG